MRKDRVYYLCLILSGLMLFFPGKTAAQQNSENSDSVEAVDLLSRAAWLFNENKLSEANELALESLQLSSSFSNSSLEEKILSLLASIQISSGKPEDAIPYYLRSIVIFEETSDTFGLVNTSSNLAGIYYGLEAYEKAGSYYKKAINYLPPDYYTEKASFFEDLGFCSLNSGNPDSAIVCFSMMKQNMLADGQDDTKALYYLVKACNEAGRYDESLVYNQALFSRFENLSDYRKMSEIKNNVAYNLTILKRYTEASEAWKEAIKYAELANSPPTDQAILSSNTGICLQNMGKWKQAIPYLRKAVIKYDEAGAISEKAGVQDVLAQIYFAHGDLYNAGLNSSESIQSARISGNASQLSQSCFTYSKILREGNDPIKALEYYEEYLRIRDSLQFINRMEEEKLAGLKLDLEQSEKELNLKVREEQVKKLTIKQLTLQLEKEEKEKALMLREKEVDNLEKERLRQSLEIGNQKHAAEQAAREKKILEQESRIKDLRLEQDSRKQMEQQQEISLLETQKERDALLIERQKAAKKAMILIIVLTALAALSILYNLITARRKNILLAKQKKEIQEQNANLEQKNDEISAQRDEIEAQRDMVFTQKEEIEQIHTEITKSIEYARKIQTSILPKPAELAELVKESFVFFRPRDIVSGDFYWFTRLENTTVISVADCTGHGVPGAIMSMLGMSLLKEIVLKEYITQPAVILRRLRKEIVNALGQKGESGEQRDGMDMALISIHHDTGIIEFAGAFNPMYLIRNKDDKASPGPGQLAVENDARSLYIIQADKMPIAHYDRMDKFNNEEFRFNEGDQFYLFTDGFADQFGGPLGKKFMYKPFMKLLLQNSALPMEKQGQRLSSAFEKWKGDIEQIDDVCVIGISL